MSERKLGQIGFWKKGEPAVWASASCLTVILLITLTLIYVIIVNGLGVFWPHQLVTADLKDGTKVTGEILDREKVPNSSSYRLRFKTGNRDLYELDFRWVLEDEMTERTVERDIVALERLEYGNFFGFVQSVTDADGETVTGEGAFDALLAAEKALNPMRHQLEKLGKKINGLNYKTEKANKTIQKKLYKGATETDPDIVAQQEVLKTIKADFDRVVADYERIEHEMEAYKVVMIDSNGEEKEMHVAHLVRIYQPNRMSLGAKIGFYGMKVKELLTEEPREANTEGGLMPAIFGTVMLVFVMSIFCFPFGVIAGIYLREYAKDGWLLKTVRIAVNNLAGVPSIVYGVFGLGFFIYGIGETIDHVFYPEMLPTPTFGTGGLLWASLTLGLLTLPVVIVATEEAFGAIPRGVREASLALGATKLQTLCRVLLPMASPGIMTGFILAMARAAGEVAPLMITGVVKLAPALPIDGQAPFIHLNRKFMHLGFHIYDIGFQAPNVEAAKPMVFVTTFLLVLVVLIMASTAILLRNRMKKKFTLGAF